MNRCSENELPSENPESTSGRFVQTVQPLRDLESNWAVDLAKNLEEYLLKICSGEISGKDDILLSVNFAEAALLLQGSVQVYSRKVEYLYSLVLHALEFISLKSQEDQVGSSSVQPDATATHKQVDEADDTFWSLDNIPVEPKNLLDAATCADVTPGYFVRPPANLVVLEGEFLDAVGDAGELESYLLATTDLYRDFILLDPCDAVTVDDFLNCIDCKVTNSIHRCSSVTSKDPKAFRSPSRFSAGNIHKLSAEKKQEANLSRTPFLDHGSESNDNMESSPATFGIPVDNGYGHVMEDGHSGDADSDDSDDDDPWKPLNPHEQGNLKVKPYKKVKANKRPGVGPRKHLVVATEFPLAKLRGPISNELIGIWEAKFNSQERLGKSSSLPLYEKLRHSLIAGERETNTSFYNPDDNTEDYGYDSGDPDTGPPDFDMPNHSSYNDVPQSPEKNDTGNNQFGVDDTSNHPDANASLEDLCRSHLDALLATLAETENQTELSTRVSTWKQRIEQNLEEQEAHPPFDIHGYGEKVLDKISVGGDNGNGVSFGDVVRGQEKHDIARTFSALLQLVNNGDVDLQRSSPTDLSTCYSGVKPFYVRLLRNDGRKGILLQSSKKRPKSPSLKGNGNVKYSKDKENCPVFNSSPPGSASGCRFSVNLGKSSGSRCTPEGKKRRKSRSVAASLGQYFMGRHGLG